MARVHYCAKKKLAASLTNMTISGRSFAIKTVLRQVGHSTIPLVQLGGARCISVVRAFAYGEPIELFRVPATAPRLV